MRVGNALHRRASVYPPAYTQDMNMSNALVEQLLAWIESHDPDSLLMVAASGDPLVAAAEQVRSDTGLTRIAPDQAATDMPGSAVYDLAVVCDALQALEKSKGERLLGRLRDVQAKAVLVASQAQCSCNWTPTDFIALGFKRCRTQTDVADGWLLYRFNIYDYKDTPSWLNARNWANPERWGQGRW